MKFKFINPIKSTSQKQMDKFNLTLRLGKITLVDIDLDVSKKEFKLEIFNCPILVSAEKKEENKDA